MKFIILALFFFSTWASAKEINSIPNEYIGLWGDSVRTCKTKEPNGDFMLLVNVTPKLIEASYAESSFTFKPIFIEADWMHNKALPTAGWYAPYYDEDGDQQQKPVLMNVTLFKERNGLYILPLASTKLVKC